MSRAKSKVGMFGILLVSLILILGIGVGVIGFLQSGATFEAAPPTSAPGWIQTSTALTTTAYLQGGPPMQASASYNGAVLSTSSNGINLPSTIVVNPGRNTLPSATRVTGTTQSRAPIGGQIEFFANVSLTVSSPQTAVGKVEAIAIERGGYLSFSTVTNGSAYVILRVPASDYQQALTEVQAIGNVTSLITTSNDVSIKVTNLNATLQSLLTEKASLFKILGQSTSINATLRIESQIQQIDSQTNSIQSQILNTQRLIDYSTITASLTKATPKAPLSVRVVATPRSGLSPLAVTFHTTTKGGTAPDLINYNFGDGTSAEGEVLVHEFSEVGDYNTTITVTDSAGSVIEQSVLIHVSSHTAGEALSQFLGTSWNLFTRVLEGIVEVAVVTIPLAIVLAVVVIPVSRKYFKGEKAKAES